MKIFVVTPDPRGFQWREGMFAGALDANTSDNAVRTYSTAVFALVGVSGAALVATAYVRASRERIRDGSRADYTGFTWRSLHVRRLDRCRRQRVLV
ncbi:MAG: hypothetical protein WEB52_12375 [Dehalococcoidia bacterium]